MEIVSYTDDEGFDWAVWADDTMNENEYDTLPHAGPPDLSSIGLGRALTKGLQNGLVDLNILCAPDIAGRGMDIMNLLKKLGIDNARDVYRHIVHIYQVEYYT